ncbi:hypothetical protein JCM11491_003021 [Sporobolomyces phaffii]
MAQFQPTRVRHRTCCLCVPARIGTLALSTLSMLVAVTVALQATRALLQDNFVTTFSILICLVESRHLWINVVLGSYAFVVFSIDLACVVGIVVESSLVLTVAHYLDGLAAAGKFDDGDLGSSLPSSTRRPGTDRTENATNWVPPSTETK